jgi:hypothetical protein
MDLSSFDPFRYTINCRISFVPASNYFFTCYRDLIMLSLRILTPPKESSIFMTILFPILFKALSSNFTPTSFTLL